MMNGQMETQLGRVTIDHEVIATYAGSVAVECFEYGILKCVFLSENVVF